MSQFGLHTQLISHNVHALYQSEIYTHTLSYVKNVPETCKGAKTNIYIITCN